MRPVHIDAFDLPSLWYQVLNACLKEGYQRPVFRGARQGAQRLELDSAMLRVITPSNRPIVPDVPEGVPPPCDLAYVHRYLRYLITPEKTEEEMYTYGERIAAPVQVDETMHHIDKIEGERLSSHAFSQLDKVIEFLKETPETNRGIIEIGRAEDLLFKHPPCMRLIHLKVRYEKLHMWLYFRSWDAWGGLPANLAALQLVKEYIGRQLKVDDGEMYAMSAGLHLYNQTWDLARKVLGETKP